jgi:hypothetical protein
MWDIISIAYKEGGMKRLLLGGERILSFGFNYFLNR